MFAIYTRRTFALSLKRARHDQIFDNVLKRKEHNHARCSQCSMYTAVYARGFMSRAEESEWESKRAGHTKKYLNWRVKEECLCARAINEPHKITVIRIDDTENWSSPHPGNRIPKDLCGKDGPEVTLKQYSVNQTVSYRMYCCAAYSDIDRRRRARKAMVYIFTQAGDQEGGEQVFHL